MLITHLETVAVSLPNLSEGLYHQPFSYAKVYKFHQIIVILYSEILLTITEKILRERYSLLNIVKIGTFLMRNLYNTIKPLSQLRY